MKKRNKKHRPGPVSAVSGLFAIQKKHDDAAMQKPMTEEDIGDLAIAFRLAFAAMLNGGADEQQWSTCVVSLNIAMVLAEQGIGEEYIRQFNDALEGAFRARIRANHGSGWGFDGPAQQAIKLAFEAHEAQLQCSTKREIRDALLEVYRRVDSGDVFKGSA